MFKKILIANRGEIACRVIKTARKMGIKTVAVYSDADKNALHVEMADEAVHIGPAPANQSYLVMENIIAAAKQTKAEAIHPGYGFLSENAAFAKKLRREKIAFIGPNVKAIEVMGDKIESKKFAAKAKVNTVPGYMGVIKTPAEAVKIAKDIGFPVMIKASAGGGGKGMRIAHGASEVEEGFLSSQSEAKSSFGDDRIFIEKFIVDPRHIEIQVLADGHGHAIHLGERECSIQRRNQKVIEEAPSPFLDEATRQTMGAQAVALAKAVKYQSAGTVEFIVDKDKNFYFLEMNTRLQVEHPVTELVTGIDLVEQMIRVAAGQKLSIKQEDVRLRGSSIESRVYAEDPFRGFLPSTGRLTYYRPPEERIFDGKVVRNDTGVYEGGEISLFYDPMIAKLITYAPTRKEAIDLMADSLDNFYIDGIQHNIPFLSALMQHPRWVSGDLSTGFIAEEYPDGFEGVKPDSQALKIFSAVALYIDRLSNQRRRNITHQMSGQPVEFALDRIVNIDGQSFQAVVSGADDKQELLVNIKGSKGQSEDIAISSNWWFGNPVWAGLIDGKLEHVQLKPIANGFELSYRGARVQTHVYTMREAELAALMPIKEAPDTSKFLLCPMPGLIVKLHVGEGDEVKAGQPLCVVEAMKMENILRAEKDGVVAKVNAAEGDSLAVDAVIMEFGEG